MARSNSVVDTLWAVAGLRSEKLISNRGSPLFLVMLPVLNIILCIIVALVRYSTIMLVRVYSLVGAVISCVFVVISGVYPVRP